MIFSRNRLGGLLVAGTIVVGLPRVIFRGIGIGFDEFERLALLGLIRREVDQHFLSVPFLLRDLFSAGPGRGEKLRVLPEPEAEQQMDDQRAEQADHDGPTFRDFALTPLAGLQGLGGDLFGCLRRSEQHGWTRHKVGVKPAQIKSCFVSSAGSPMMLVSEPV